MAEDKVEPREINWRQLLPWTELFQGFRVALDVNKLALAAAGILVMAIGWLALGSIFYAMQGKKPIWDSTDYTTASVKIKDDSLSKEEIETQKLKIVWNQFKRDRDKWNLMHEAAGPGDSEERTDAGDLADSPEELKAINANLNDLKNDLKEGKKTVAAALDVAARESNGPARKTLTLLTAPLKPTGRLRTLPFFEDRGPNPYLAVTGQSGKVAADGSVRRVPWEAGHFYDWMLTVEAPVLIEPLYKFLRPAIYFFDHRAGFLARFYLILVVLVTLATWALFGGAITRIAAVQLARKEKIGLMEAVRFTMQRYLSYFTAPTFPLIFAAALVVLMSLFGFIHMIPILGEIADGLLWGVMLILGLVMAVVLIGLVGWPLMSATISAEGADGWEAVSRSYSYIFQAVWHYLWYSLVALAYGAVVVFFVGFMGSFLVYLTKWGVSQTPGIEMANRDPAFLFVWTPTSFGWRELLLQGVKVDGKDLVENGHIDPVAYKKYVWSKNPDGSEYKGKERFAWYNYIGAFLVSIWVYLVFLGILGFGYSYFWTSSTIIYLLLRRKVDDAEMDEIYMEEDEREDAYRPASAPTTITPPAVSGPSRTMVDAPTLRTSGSSSPVASTPLPTIAVPTETPKPADSSPPVGGNGDKPATGGI